MNVPESRCRKWDCSNNKKEKPNISLQHGANKKHIILIICLCCSSHVTHSLLNCVRSFSKPTPPHVSHALPIPSSSSAPGAAELCIFCEGADKQNHSCKKSLFWQCVVSGNSVRAACRHFPNPQTDTISRKIKTNINIKNVTITDSVMRSPQSITVVYFPKGWKLFRP